MDMLPLITQAAHTIMADLGAGYSESCYQNALFNTIAKFDPSAQKEFTIHVIYDDQLIGTCRADIVTGQYVIEVKATRTMPPQVGHQIRKYLVNLYRQDQITRSGIIINFNQESERAEIIMQSADERVTILKKRRQPSEAAPHDIRPVDPRPDPI